MSWFGLHTLGEWKAPHSGVDSRTTYFERLIVGRRRCGGETLLQIVKLGAGHGTAGYHEEGPLRARPFWGADRVR